MGKMGYDIHVPVLSGLIAEKTAVHLVKEQRGKIIFCKMKNDGIESWGTFYVGNDHGPYEVIPNRAIGFKNLTSIGHISRFLKSRDLNEIPEVMDFEDLKKMKFRPIQF